MQVGVKRDKIKESEIGAYCYTSDDERAAEMKYVNGQDTVTYFCAVLFHKDGENK